VKNNIITENEEGITIIYKSGYNIIEENLIGKNKIGVDMEICGINSVQKNTIKLNKIGIILFFATYDLVFKNNFFLNAINAAFISSFFNVWLRNYWTIPLFLPKSVFGLFIYSLPPYFLILPWLNFDFVPRLLPYIS